MRSKKELSPHASADFKPEPKTYAAVLGYIVTLAGLPVALYPGITNASAAKIAIIASCVLIASVGLFWSYIVENLRAMYGRIRDYPQLHRRASTDSNSLNALRQNTLELMLANSSAEQEEKTTQITSDLAFQRLKKGVLELATRALVETSFQINKQSLDRGKLVITIEDGEASLAEGDKVLVVDTADLYEMGTFEIVERREEQCYAVGGNDVDKLWLGEVREVGETSLVVKKVAILLERSDK